MLIDLSHESFLQITVGCAVVVALLRLTTALLETVLKAKLHFRFACFFISVVLELGRPSGEEASMNQTSKNERANR